MGMLYGLNVCKRINMCQASTYSIITIIKMITFLFSSQDGSGPDVLSFPSQYLCTNTACIQCLFLLILLKCIVTLYYPHGLRHLVFSKGLLASLIILVNTIVREKPSKTSMSFLVPNLAVSIYIKNGNTKCIQVAIDQLA